MLILGIDEVGRGSLAGPLVVGAVVLGGPIAGLKDSKLLSRKKRQLLSIEIDNTAIYSGLGWVSAKEIDQIGLSQALSLAATRATLNFNIPVQQVIIDGNYNFFSSHPLSQTLVKADQYIPSVSAASIIAKVSRDNYMIEQSIIYSEYGFDKHVGYGTRLHIARLEDLGPCLLHRKTFSPLVYKTKKRSS